MAPFDPPFLEPKMKGIRWRVAVLWSFEIFPKCANGTWGRSSVVRNVAKKERILRTWDQCKKFENWRPTDRPTDQQLTTDLRANPQSTHFKYFRWPYLSNASSNRIDFVFDSRAEFLGTTVRTAPFSVGSNSSWCSMLVELSSFNWFGGGCHIGLLQYVTLTANLAPEPVFSLHVRCCANICNNCPVVAKIVNFSMAATAILDFMGNQFCRSGT